MAAFRNGLKVSEVPPPARVSVGVKTRIYYHVGQRWRRGFVEEEGEGLQFLGSGSRNYDGKCRFLHSWSIGDTFSLLTALEGHQKVNRSQVVTGILMPSGQGKLYTGSKDEHVRIWDYECVDVIHLGGEIGCMISEGPWVLIGLPNLVKARNTKMVTDMSLRGPVGEFYSLVVWNDMLFAGTQWLAETM